MFACKMKETLINQLPDGDDLIDRLTHEFEQVDQLDDPDFTNTDFLEEIGSPGLEARCERSHAHKTSCDVKERWL